MEVPGGCPHVASTAWKQEVGNVDGRGPGGVGFPEAVMEDRACGRGNAFISTAPARGSPFLSVRLACEGDVPLPGPAAGRWV